METTADTKTLPLPVLKSFTLPQVNHLISLPVSASILTAAVLPRSRSSLQHPAAPTARLTARFVPPAPRWGAGLLLIRAAKRGRATGSGERRAAGSGAGPRCHLAVYLHKAPCLSRPPRSEAQRDLRRRVGRERDDGKSSPRRGAERSRWRWQGFLEQKRNASTTEWGCTKRRWVRWKGNPSGWRRENAALKADGEQ